MSYKDLKSYQSATIIYDFTVEFVKLYIDYKSRTRDQMEQAARSGKQNIVEAAAERASEKSEIKLTGVARASLEELLEDYRDFLRQRGFAEWTKDDARAKEIRALAYKTDKTYGTYKSYIENPESAGNAMICLINQCNFLLDRQIKALEEDFVKDGDYSEKLSAKRQQERKRNFRMFPEW